MFEMVGAWFTDIDRQIQSYRAGQYTSISMMRVQIKAIVISILASRSSDSNPSHFQIPASVIASD